MSTFEGLRPALAETIEPHRDSDENLRTLLTDRFPYRPTLFLGVGGTGVKAVHNMKVLYRDLLAPRLAAGMKAADPSEIDRRYQFLALDTDGDSAPQSLQRGREWLHVSVADLQGFYEQQGSAPEYRDWLFPDYPLGSLNAGCKGIRNLGRLAFVYNAGKIASAIQERINEAQEAAADPSTRSHDQHIYVMGSVSGGTGAGFLLDLMFLLRRLTEDRPGVSMIGILGVLDGEPSMAFSAQQRLRANSFAFLKELDYFMRPQTLAGGPQRNEILRYTGGREGIVKPPFDECHLVTPYRHDGSHGLPTQDHVSAFMARYAFMMSAYSYPGEGVSEPTYHGTITNMGTDLADPANKGTRYLVPGLAQVHFPTSEIADCCVIMQAREFLEFLMGGEPEHSAGISDTSGLAALPAIRDSCHRFRDSLAIFETPDFQALLDRLKSAERYQAKREILAVGEGMLSARRNELSGALQSWIDSEASEFQRILDASVLKVFGSDQGRCAGTITIIERVRERLERNVTEVDTEFDEVAQGQLEGLQSQWREVRRLVEDICTDDGVVDRWRDYLRLPSVLQLYEGFLTALEGAIREVSINRAIRVVLIRQLAYAEELLERTRRVHEIIPDALHHLGGWENAIRNRLQAQTRGRGNSVLNVSSYSVFRDDAIDHLFDGTRMTPKETLMALERQGQHPGRFLLYPQGEGEAWQGARGLAILALGHIDRLGAFGEWREASPLNFLNGAMGNLSKDPAEQVASVVYNALKPQARIAGMKNKVGMEPNVVHFAGGIDNELRSALLERAMIGRGQLKVAENQEANRLNFFSATLPIALAGCDLVAQTLEPEYNRWMQEVEDNRELSPAKKELALRLFHCFPQAWRWRSPTRVPSHESEAERLFAQTLAVSFFLDVSDDDAKRMRALKGLKNLGYGIFQFGQSHFWSFPFIAPRPVGFEGENDQHWKEAEEQNRTLYRLGSNVRDAYLKFAASPDIQKRGRRWVEWFEDNHGVVFTQPMLEERRKGVLAEFASRRGRSNVPKEHEYWDRFSQVVRDWSL